jgi:phosphoglycolate phosphatase
MRNVIFDWSGTLVDDLGAVHAATNAVLKQYGGAELTIEQFRSEFALPVADFYQRVLPEVPFSEIDIAYQRQFAHFTETVALFPGVSDFLEDCYAAGFRLFVLSTIRPDHFEAQAARLGIKKFFTKAYVGVTDKRKAILSLLEENGLRSSETFLVGDMTHDLDAAREGRLMGIGVRSGFDTPEKLCGSDPDILVRDLPSLHHLTDILKRGVRDEWIEIAGLELESKIGVPSGERAEFQRLSISIRFQIRNGFSELRDDLSLTIDYAAVSAEAKRIAFHSNLHLIETLVSEIADALMNRFPFRKLEIELRKFILPGVRHVSVKTTRAR